MYGLNNVTVPRKLSSHILAIASLIGTPSLIFVSTSLPLFLNNQSELNYQLSVFQPFLILFFLFFAIGVVCWRLAIRGKSRILLWAYYLAGPLFVLFTIMRDYPLLILDRLVGLFVFFAFGCFVVFFCSKKASPLSAINFFAILSISFLGVDLYRVNEQLDFEELAKKNKIVSVMPMIEAKNEAPNIYHIILDAFQSDVFSSILTEEVHLQFDDFVYYSEASAVYSMTSWSVPSVMLGKSYDFTMPLTQYQYQALNSDQSLLHKLKESGYENLAYTRKRYPFKLEQFDQTIQHADNSSLASDRRPQLDQDENFISMWVYRHLPKAITIRLARRGMLINEQKMDGFGNNTFLPESAPMESYLSFQKFLATEQYLPKSGRYTFIHLLLPHAPYIFDSDCVKSDSASVFTQSRCSVLIVSHFLKELKRLGRYEDSMIVIHGDHGDELEFIDQKPKPTDDRSHRTLLRS